MAGQVISRLTSSGGTDAGVHVISSSFYGTCSTAADTSAKEIIIQNRNIDQQISLTKGMLLVVKFDYGNTNGTSLPTFQLFKNNAASSTSVPVKGNSLSSILPVFAQARTNIKPSWNPGSVVTFIYDTYTYTDPNTGTNVTSGCWIKAAGISDEVIFGIKDDEGQVITTGLVDRVETIQSDIYTSQVVADIEFIYWPENSGTPPENPASSSEYQWTTDALPYEFGVDIWQRTKSYTIGDTSNPTYSDPVCISGRDGAKGDTGDTGAAALTYALIADVTSLTRDVNTTTPVNNPSSITFSATKTEGNGAPLSYLEGKLTVNEYIYNTNESRWEWNSLITQQAFSPSNQSISVTPSNRASMVRGTLFASDGTTQLDTQTIPIIETGRNGEDGEDAVVAYLTNESCSFAATSSAAIAASASSQFIVNQGGQPLSVTINTITPDITSTPAYNNGALTVTSENNTFTIGINPSFTIADYQQNGSFRVTASASVNGTPQTFTKDFSWVLVPAGVDGKNGTNGANGFNIADVKLYKVSNSSPGKPENALVYTFNNQTLTPTPGWAPQDPEQDPLYGWSTDMPNMESVTPGWSCYLISANAASLESTDIIELNDWYGPVVFVQNGTDGLNAYNHATISLYQRYNPQSENDKPTKPGDNTYNFSEENSGFVNSLGKWKLGVDAAENGEPCWITSVNLVSQETTTAVPSNRWSDPVIFTRDGANGEGVSITNREIHYIESTSGTVTPDSNNWSTTIPEVAEGKYLWTRTRVTYSDGNTLTSYSVAKQGEGITVTSSSIQYATNNSTTTPTSGWQNTPPSTTPGWYIWTKTTTNYSDGTAVTSYSVGKTGTNGSNAYLYELHCSPSVITVDQNATTPAFSPTSVTLSATRTDGNNTPAAYSGRFKLEWTSDNSTWTAVATNGNSNVSSWAQTITPVSVTAATAFRATLYKAGGTTDVLDYETIPVIRGGKNGINGYNQGTINLYKRSEEQPDLPKNSHTYIFASKTFDGASNNTIEGWTINKIPSGDEIAWMTFAVASSNTSTDTISASEWSVPIKAEGIDGADGFNHATIQLYKRYRFPEGENDKPTTPAANAVTYTFNPPSLTGTLNGWTQTPPEIDGNPCWITVGIAHSQSTSDVIDSWSEPVIYTKDGADGADGYNKATVYLYKRNTSEPTGNTAKPSAQLTYTFENQTLTSTDDLNGWSQTIPTNSTDPLWMIAAVANSTAATDPIATSDWSQPIKMEGIDGQPGTPGQPGVNGYNQATIDLYQRAASAPTTPAANAVTYTFSTGNITSIGSWSKTIPDNSSSNPCWVTSGVAISQEASTKISSWSAPTKMLEDSISVAIDNDNVTLPTDNGTAKATTITIGISAYKGLNQINTSIDNTKISGKVSGLSTAVNNNNSKTTTVVITITTQLTTATEKGTLTIPVVAGGITFNKQFTWSLAKNGLNQATIYLYKRAASATKPSSGNDSVYNFTDKTLTNIPSGWDTIFPTETQGSTTPVWVMTAVASSNTNTDNIPYTEWSTPVRYVSSGSNGKDAFNEAKVFLYRRSTETPVAPTFNEPFNYTFSTGLTANSYNTNTSPAVTWYTDPALATVTSGAATSNTPRNDHMPCWISINHPISQSESATITSNWSTPTIFAQPGKGIVKVTEYYLATNSATNVTVETTGWITPNNEVTPPITIPQLNSNAIYLWNYEATEYTDGVIRIIAPHIIATYDANKGSFSSITNYYQKTRTATTVPEKNDNDWSTSVLQVDNEWKYLWNYKKITYTSGEPEYTDVHLIGIYGDNGIGIEDIIEQQILWPYDDSDISTHPGPGDDADWQPKGDVIWEPGKYIWSQTKVVWTDGKIDYIGRTVAKDINTLNERMRLTNTGSGTIITSDDAANLPTLSLTIHGKSVQDGTPSPSSPVEIRSVEGRNLYDPTKAVSGYLTTTGTITGATANNEMTSDFILIGGGNVVTVLYEVDDRTVHQPWICVQWFKADKTFGGQLTRNIVPWDRQWMRYIVPTDGVYVRVSARHLSSGYGALAVKLGYSSFYLSDYGSIGIVSSNANVADPSNVFDSYFFPTEPYSYGSRSTTALEQTMGFIPLEGTERIGFSVDGCASDMTQDSTGGWMRLLFLNDDGDKVAIIERTARAQYTYTASTIKLNDAVEVPAGATSVAIGFRTYGGTPCIRLDGSNEFVEHQGTYTPIELDGNAAHSISDVRDRIGIDSEGNVTLVKQVGIVTGSDLVRYNASNGYIAYRAPAVTSTSSNINGRTLCSWTTANKSFNSSNMTEECVQYPSAGSQVVYVAALEGRSLDDFCLLYVLATPQTISLGKIDLPSLPSPSFSMHVDALVTPTLDAEWWTTLGYETGKQHTAANSLLAALSNEITKTQEVLTNNAVIETNQWWFITDKKEKPNKPDEQLINNTGNYDNWVTRVSDSYIIINPNETNNRYEITKDTSNNYIIKDKIIQDTAGQNRDVTEFCIIKKQDNNDEYIYKYYPYNYYCYEYKFLNGEITYSEVIYDSVKSSIAENKIAEEYQQKALEKLLNDQTQVFYSDNNGAHVKETTGSNYETTWNTTGIIFSQGDAKLLDILAISGENGKYSGMNIYNGKTGQDEQKIAQFIPNLIQLGSDAEDRVRITREKIEFIKENKSAAEIGNDGFYTPNITVDSKLSLKTPTESINSGNQNETYEWAWIPRSNGNIAFKWIGTPDPNL